MGVGVVGMDVVEVVGGQQRQLEVLREAQQVATDALLDGQPVVHHLGVEVALAKNVAELRGRRHGIVVLTQTQERLHFTGGAAGGPDEALAVLVEKLPVGAGLVEEALE